MSTASNGLKKAHLFDDLKVDVSRLKLLFIKL